MSEIKRENVRNVAIIAHVDHGKTTLIDKLLRGSGIWRDNQEFAERIMDSNELEKEKGITIKSKSCSFPYAGQIINIVDTPGHADFGGEVERIMMMVDGCLLLIDAFEGPMPQTKFVLKKALEAGVKPIVVINKVDRPEGRPKECVEMAFDLFVELGASDEQLDFPIIYASGKNGFARYELEDKNVDMVPLLDTIVKKIPPPPGDFDSPFQMLITNLEYSDYLGRIAFGRVVRGKVKTGSTVAYIKKSGEQKTAKITKIFGYYGVKQVEREEAIAGDIVGIAGIPDIFIGETIADAEKPEPLPVIEIDPPTLSMNFMVNNGPFAGREGNFVTARHLRERLYKEIQTNVSLQVEDTGSADTFKVSGRGEMQLAILIETMRREGFELMVSKPEVITKEVNGKVHEPMENLVVDIEEQFMGVVMEKIGKRKGEMQNMHNFGTHVRLEFLIPARGLLGLQNEFRTDTKGTGLLNHCFYEYGPHKGEIPSRQNGVLISMETGLATSFALNNIQERGILFIDPVVDVYAGMIVGENAKNTDMCVNPCKRKHLTNMRTAGSEDAIRLVTPLKMSLEQCLEYIAADEFLEVTPKTLRLRKRYLDENERKRRSRELSGKEAE